MKKALFAILIFLSLPYHAAAGGSFKILPATVFLTPERKTETLKITNQTDAEKVSFQLNAMKWTQNEEGKDVYEPTDEIVFFPKIIIAKKDEEIMIRVGYQRQEETGIEKAYRLFIRELPVSKPGENTLKMTVNMGVPVFVSPAKNTKSDKAKYAEGKSVENIAVSNGNLMIKVKNSGNIHFSVQKIAVSGFDASNNQIFSQEVKGWYVLPGITKSFPCKIPDDVCVRIKTVHAAAHTDNAVLESKTEISQLK